MPRVLLVLALSVAAPGAPARAASPPALETVKASAGVEIALPAKGRDARDARYALGKDPAAAARKVAVETLTLDRSFLALVDARGDYLVSLRIDAVDADLQDHRGETGRASAVKLTGHGSFRITRGASVVAAAPLEAIGRSAAQRDAGDARDPGIGKDDYTAAWHDLVRQATRLAFETAYHAGAFRAGASSP